MRRPSHKLLATYSDMLETRGGGGSRAERRCLPRVGGPAHAAAEDERRLSWLTYPLSTSGSNPQPLEVWKMARRRLTSRPGGASVRATLEDRSRDRYVYSPRIYIYMYFGALLAPVGIFPLRSRVLIGQSWPPFVHTPGLVVPAWYFWCGARRLRSDHQHGACARARLWELIGWYGALHAGVATVAAEGRCFCSAYERDCDQAWCQRWYRVARE